MKSRKQHWFHCSARFHGQTWTVGRTCPKNVSTKEPMTPRLCVASTIARCFAARLFRGDVFVYRTKVPRSGLKPIRVYDAVITQERWLIPPVEMVLHSIVQANMTERACRRTRDFIEIHDRAPGTFQRFQAFQDAIDALGPECSTSADRRFVTWGLERFGMQEVMP